MNGSKTMREQIDRASVAHQPQNDTASAAAAEELLVAIRRGAREQLRITLRREYGGSVEFAAWVRTDDGQFVRKTGIEVRRDELPKLRDELMRVVDMIDATPSLKKPPPREQRSEELLVNFGRSGQQISRWTLTEYGGYRFVNARVFARANDSEYPVRGHGCTLPLRELQVAIAAIDRAINARIDPQRSEPTPLLAEVASVATRIENEEILLRTMVAEARLVGATWETIGVALGVSKQAAQQRFGAAQSPTPASAEPQKKERP